MNLFKLGRTVSYCSFYNVLSKPYTQMATNLGADKDLVPPSFSADNKEYPKHIHEIVNRISSLTLLEVADLSELLRKKLNIKSAPANIKTDVSKDEAEQIKKVLEEVGASIAIE
ncbi:unnamed protein product [Schistosoma curassoni]|uniref:Ribosomal_L12 domain-containing protein n=1 Tax=Schistosoma curassoni TaxID=6186 RepID=A0A183KSA8_9TREM|nr:unnamed protein product [Schistosoma curassoni]